MDGKEFKDQFETVLARVLGADCPQRVRNKQNFFLDLNGDDNKWERLRTDVKRGSQLYDRNTSRPEWFHSLISISLLKFFHVWFKDFNREIRPRFPNPISYSDL